jgi:serine protease Do
VLRQGKTEHVQVAIGHLDEDKVASNDKDGSSHTDALGVTLSSLNSEVRDRLHVPKTVSGALISRVAPDSPAANVGLQAGDVIQQINGEKVTGPSDATDKVAEAAKQKGKPLLLLVDRHGQESFITVPLDGADGQG